VRAPTVQAVTPAAKRGSPPLAIAASGDASPFAATIANDGAPPGPAPPGMVWIPGGEFSMGATDAGSTAAGTCSDPMGDAWPVHRVYVDGFWMDATEVTNEAFDRFVRATGYVTVAERAPTAEEFPDAPPENLIAGSVVFTPPGRPVPLDSQLRWWAYRKGASWRQPTGPGSNLRGRARYPVVQVAYADAAAYAAWAKKRLPTEAEFEFAARGGLSGKRFAWGDELRPGGRWMANVFEGHFPDRDTGDDGWAGIAPVASFPPNGYGLYDVAGNVWEWVADWYRSDYYASFDLGRSARNPRGPEDSRDPGEPGVAKRVQRGGSFLCSSEYCARYLVGSRGRGEPSSGANHLGFRCVADRGQ
jgi:formylglycine-generating enzyme